jgi:hypothetical protein
MSARFVTVDRHTPELLPPDLQEWVPEDDRVHLGIEAVELELLESVSALVAFVFICGHYSYSSP